MDYFSACDNLPKPRFAVGQRVRIVGPSYSARHDRTGEETTIIAQENDDPFYDVIRIEGSHSCVYHASSLAPIAEVPAPRFKRGDKVKRKSGGVQLTVTGIEYDGKVWVYIFNTGNATLVIAEEYLTPAPAEPEYLPTIQILIGRNDHRDSRQIFRGQTYNPEEFNIHAIYDMPDDENGVQVDFVRLIEAGYAVTRNVSLSYSWRGPLGGWLAGGPTAIDAWRAAARHYLANREKK
jgi:uncharacterized protein YodC (DUF2158 family)